MRHVLHWRFQRCPMMGGSSVVVYVSVCFVLPTVSWTRTRRFFRECIWSDRRPVGDESSRESVWDPSVCATGRERDRSDIKKFRSTRSNGGTAI